MGVYDLAAMWSFKSVGTLSLTRRNTTSTSPLFAPSIQPTNLPRSRVWAIKNDVITKTGLECIQLGQKYNVGQWIKRGIHFLIKQLSPLVRKAMEDSGLSLSTTCAIYAARDQAVLRVAVNVHRNSTYGHTNFTPTEYLTRDESRMHEAAEEIFASDYAAYGGIGKESLFL